MQGKHFKSFMVLFLIGLFGGCTVPEVPDYLKVSTYTNAIDNTLYTDENTKKSVTSALSNARAKNEAMILFNEAKPSIDKMLNMVACDASKSIMNAYTDPDSSIHSYVSPFVGLKYHKSGCLDILRITNITKKAANAVAFKVTYISRQSKESKNRGYTAIMQPSGEWLFKWSYYY